MARFKDNNVQQSDVQKRGKMHPARFSRPKSTFLTIHILVAGTNSVSSGNIVEESFFDKYFAENHFEYANKQITHHFWL
jgi:hypothetical protein